MDSHSQPEVPGFTRLKDTSLSLSGAIPPSRPRGGTKPPVSLCLSSGTLPSPLLLNSWEGERVLVAKPFYPLVPFYKLEGLLLCRVGRA